ALKNLRVYACALRKIVLAAGGAGAALVYRAPGYQLTLQPAELDAAEFDRLARHGRNSLRDGDLKRATGLLRSALNLWRGAPLEERSEERRVGKECSVRCVREQKREHEHYV